MIKNLNNIYFTIEKNEVLYGELIELRNILILVCLNNSKIRKLFVDVHE